MLCFVKNLRMFCAIRSTTACDIILFIVRLIKK